MTFIILNTIHFHFFGITLCFKVMSYIPNTNSQCIQTIVCHIRIDVLNYGILIHSIYLQYHYWHQLCILFHVVSRIIIEKCNNIAIPLSKIKPHHLNANHSTQKDMQIIFHDTYITQYQIHCLFFLQEFYSYILDGFSFKFGWLIHEYQALHYA